jgi:hypothetical protein
MSYLGLDYGLGRTNIDVKTGIRYGVISEHSVGQAWYDSAEPDYGEPTCGKCGNAACASDAAPDDISESDWFEGKDYYCEHCRRTFWSDDAFGDEPNGFSYDADGYRLTTCLNSDIMILESPYYTFAQFCSPCVPGAGNIDSPMPDGVKTYCLGHDWFESGKAPYPVYSVKTGEMV